MRGSWLILSLIIKVVLNLSKSSHSPSPVVPLNYNFIVTVQLSYKVTSARMLLASFTRVTREYHMCRSQVSCMLLVSISHVAKLRVPSTQVYFCSSFSLQVISELANSRRSKQTTVLG